MAFGVAALAPVVEARAATIADLPHILEMADRNHPNVAAARARLLQARAQLDEAHYAPFSQFQLTGGVAVAPTLLGNNVFSPNTDVSLTSNLGVAWRAGIDGRLPIWTFGKITNLWDAAAANVKVNEADVEKERDAVRVDVRKAFFGLQLARESLGLLRGMKSSSPRARPRSRSTSTPRRAIPSTSPRSRPTPPRSRSRESEAVRYVDVALSGLRFYTGVKDLDIVPGDLKPPRHQLGHVSRYLSAAALYRPEVQMARAGVAARRAQVQLARLRLFPDVGLGVQVGLSAAPEIADQINPFVTDPGNFFHYGVAIVFQWKLDFLPQAARIRFAEAQLEEVRSQQRFALGGVGAEVEIAYAEVIDWKRRVDIYTKAVSAAKRWLVLVQQGIDLGAREDKELIEPAKEYALRKYGQLNAVMELDMAMSRLAKATGWDAIAPDGM